MICYAPRRAQLCPIFAKATWPTIHSPSHPSPEQRRIATVLNAIQDAIAAQEDVIAAARAFKRSLMQRLFTYGPGREPAPTKETEIGEIPAHWEVTPFGEFVAEGPQNGLYKPLSQYRDGTPILRIADYDNDGYFATLGFREVEVDETERRRYTLAERMISSSTMSTACPILARQP